MDPNATLEKIQKSTDAEEADYFCEILFNWLENNGFDPYWLKYPLGRKIYYKWLTTVHPYRLENIKDYH